MGIGIVKSILNVVVYPTSRLSGLTSIKLNKAGSNPYLFPLFATSEKKEEAMR